MKLAEENARLKAKLREAEEAIEQADEDAAQADHDAEEMERKYKLLKTEFDALRKSLASQQTMAASQDSTSVNASVSQAAIERLNQEISDLKDENNALKHQIATYTAVQAENDRISSENAQLQLLLKSQKSSIDQHQIDQEALEQLQNEIISKIQKAYSEVTSQLSDANATIAELQAKQLKHESSIGAYRSEIEEKDADIASLQKQLNDSIQRERKLRDKVALAEARAEQAEDKIFEANEATNLAEADAIQADEDAELFEKKLQIATAELSKLRQELETLKLQKTSIPNEAQLVAPVVNAATIIENASSMSSSSLKPVKTVPPKPVAKPVHIDSSSALSVTTSTAANTRDDITTAAPVVEIKPNVAPKKSYGIPTPFMQVKPVAEPVIATTTITSVQKSSPEVITKTATPEVAKPIAITDVLPTDAANQGVSSISKQFEAPASTRVRKTDPQQQQLAAQKKTGKAALLEWCQRMAGSKYEITNFSGSFSDGLAFCAMMHRAFPQKIPWNELSINTRERNFTISFKVAEDAGVVALLDVEDMVAMERPDPLSVMTYCSFLYKRLGNRYL